MNTLGSRRPIAPMMGVFLTGLCACSVPEEVELYGIAQDRQDLFFADRALDAAVDKFLDVSQSDRAVTSSGNSSSSGPSGSGSSGSSGSGGGGFFGGAFFGSISLPDEGDFTSSPTDYKESHSGESGLGLTAFWPMTQTLRAVVRVEAGHGRSEYDLPDGVGILIDPITVTADTTYVHSEIGANRHFKVTPWLSADLEATVGARAARNDLHIRSALLDVEDTHEISRAFVGVGAELAIAPPALNGAFVSLTARGRAYDKETAAAQTGLKLGYAHQF